MLSRVPGHRALADVTNPGRFLMAHVLEQLLNGPRPPCGIQVPADAIEQRRDQLDALAAPEKGRLRAFLGIQYWNVIRKLAQRGCRCLVLGGNPAHNVLDTAGMSLLSVDIDYPAMMQTLADYFRGHGCRHPAAMIVTPWASSRFWPPI